MAQLHFMRRMVRTLLPVSLKDYFHNTLQRYFTYHAKPYLFYDSGKVRPEQHPEVCKVYDVNVVTELCGIMRKYGSDKGLSWHNYSSFYYQLFQGYKAQRLFELGLGTTNADFHNSMGIHGKPGASLRGWRDFFPGVKVYGADIDTSVLFSESGIETFYCDQTQPEIIKSMWETNESLKAQFDIIIDDGYHNFDANITFLENSLHKLNAGGYFIVEDVEIFEIGNWRNYIQNSFLKKNPGYIAGIWVLPHLINVHDNNLIVFKKVF